jgi:Ca-activated chloride channel homolog
MKVEARLTFEQIRHDQDTDAHLVLTLTAPPIEQQTKRPALCIIPLIDVSPSMFDYYGQGSGGTKIDYAKRSVDKLIEHLGPDDYCGLVSFSGSADILQRPVKITAESKATLKRKVTDLGCGNATNIADALLTGLDIGNKADLPGNVIVRIILFTDGQANRGPETTSAGLIKLLEANLGSCTASAFGYGSDADQNLLGELAKRGSGNYAYVQNPDDALTAFGKELGGLLSTYATNLAINVDPAGEHEITDVVSDVDSEDEKLGEGVRIKIPDILAEEVRNIVLSVKLKAQKGGIGPRPVNVFSVKAGWDILDVNSKKERQGAETKAKAQFVKEGDEQKVPEPTLDKIVGLAQVIRAQLEAEEKAKKGDFKGAVQHMQAASVNLGRRGLRATEHLAHQVTSRLGSASLYQNSGGYLRSVTTGGTRGYGGASYDTSAAADLASVGCSFSNSLQSSTSNSFVDGSVVPAAPAVATPDWSMLPVDPPGAVSGLITGSVGVGYVPTTALGGVDPLGMGVSWQANVSASPGLSGTSVMQTPPSPPLPQTNSAPAKLKKLSRKSKSW